MRATSSSRPRSKRTRSEILRAAEGIFAERGFAAARLEDVADRVGIRRPSIVYHFRGKRDLYDAVLDDLFAGLLGRIENALAAQAPLADRIEAVVKAWVSYVGGRPSLAGILLREVAEASPVRSAAATRHVGPIISAVENALREGQRDGVLEQIDPIHFIFAVAGATLFFVAGTPALAPGWPFDPLSAEQLRAHETEMLQMTRRWLGIRRPRLARPAKR